MKPHILIPAAFLAATLPALADTIRSAAFEADLDPAFPALRSFTYAGHKVAIPAAKTPARLLVNGEEAKAKSTFAKTGEDSAAYRIECPEIGVALTVNAHITLDTLDWSVTDITETGDTMVMTLALPELRLLAGTSGNQAALGNFPRSGYASEKPEDWDIFGSVASLKKETRGASYAFVSDGTVASGLFTNVLDEKDRMLATADGQSLLVVPGTWTWRAILNQPDKTVVTPRARLVVATDRNGDGKATWQDAAIAYRASTPAPYGGEKTKNFPVTHIAMNFGSQATNPFLRVLDNAKKIWLYTDGLGQRIQFKGYQSEGHDSSHPDYAHNVGRRQGGRDTLNFVMRRGHDFDILSGVHINAQEYHLEAKAFSPDLVDMNKIGWSWLDKSYLTDYFKDAAYGTLNQRLADMREDLPWLDFAYLDVYYGKGWPGWNMHTQTNNLGIMQFTEFPGVMERAVVWNHVANDWTQAVWGKGDRSEIARFIYYGLKDTFKHDPLLRGSNCDGFMGWHAERDMLQTVKSAFTVNLPTKYLQHFPLLRTDTTHAWFGSDVRTEVDGKTARILGPDGQLINSCTYPKEKSRPANNLVFIPWPPCEETKIYHWNDGGGASTWTLPKSWNGTENALLYRLTDLGRVFERAIPVANGKVTLNKIQAGAPYVLYRDEPAALPEMRWGEGGLVADPGFDSHGFQSWRKKSGALVEIANNKFGQSELVFASPKSGEVSQTVKGMKPGQIYSASVWVHIADQREATLAVSPYVPTLTLKPGGDKPEFAELKRSIDRTALTNFTDQSSKYMSRWHRMKILFKAPESGRAVLALRVAPGRSEVRFDDVRLVESGISTPPKGAKNVVFFDDFENVDEGWGPFMYGWKGPMNTHLSEAHHPYTKDTIQGEFSLKSRLENSPGMLYRTVPATLKLDPDTTYRISFDYLCDKAGTFQFVAGTDEGDGNGTVKFKKVIPDDSWTVKHFTATVATDTRPDWFLGIAKLEKKKKGIIVIDNFLVEKTGTAK
jgi:endo-alpha-N-acetylgalactosaminidase